MAYTGRWRSYPRFRRGSCCPFGASPSSPGRRSSPHSHHHHHSKRSQKPPTNAGCSTHGYPSLSSKLGRGIIDPRRILSPDRVSPIVSGASVGPLPEIPDHRRILSPGRKSPIDTAVGKSEPPHSSDPLLRGRSLVPESPAAVVGAGLRERALDLRLVLKGKDGRCLMLELDPEVLCGSSAFFASMVLNSGQNASDAVADLRKIEVSGVEDLGVFGETIELMYEKDAMRWLMKAGVSRAIDILEARMA